jgi:hypothetical protein
MQRISLTKGRAILGAKARLTAVTYAQFVGRSTLLVHPVTTYRGSILYMQYRYLEKHVILKSKT